MPAFRIAGGILLFLVAVDMVVARQSGLRSVTSAETAEADDRHEVAVFPLGIPLIAGPGAITSVMLLTHSASSILEQGVVLAVIIVVLLVSGLVLIVGSRILDRLGVTGVNVIGRVFGIILAALAVEFFISGVQAAFF